MSTEFLPMPASVIGAPTNPSSTPFLESGYPSIAFLVLGSALVMLMTPGVGLLYSGMARSKNALSLILLSFLSYAIVTIQWVLFGFSLAFSETTTSSFIGNFAYGGFTSIGSQALSLTAPAVPAVVFALYQLQFATVTVAILFGSVAERIRLVPAMVFVFLWTTFVYDIVAFWTWGARGWARNLACLNTIKDVPCGIGSYDYAGGGPVHMASGFAGLAYCLIIGKRKRLGSESFSPSNMLNIFMGTAFLWFGWFGFNGGSAGAGSPRAAMAALVTTISASAGGMTWMLCESMHTKKFSGLAFCSGAIAGLVSITPGSGYVAPWASILFGIAGGYCCYLGTKIKNYFGFDDALDAWGLHALGGFVGNILTGIFAQKWVGLLDGSSIEGGWLERHWKQVGYQFAGSLAIAGWSFVVTALILIIMNNIPGLELRCSDQDEELGADMTEMGECMYELIPSDQPTKKMMSEMTLRSESAAV